MAQEMLTLPRYSGDVDGPTHTLGSAGGGDFLEPRVCIRHKVRNQSQAIASPQKKNCWLLHVPPKNNVFPFSNS